MGSSLGPVLANVLMTEFEHTIINDLVSNNTLPFYIRYVDDTLVLIKPEDIDKVLRIFNGFTPGIKFTHDSFPDENIHFLDLSINNITLETDIYYKPTHTGQYTDYNSFTPWRIKISWIRALFHRCKRICSNDFLFQNQIRKITDFMSWNGYSRSTRKSIMKRLSSTTPRENNNDSDEKKIWIRLPYMGFRCEWLTKSLIRKLQRCFKSTVKFVVLYDTRKISSYCSTKDKIPTPQLSKVIYQVTCPECGSKYIGKTERCFKIRMDEHGTRDYEPMNKHLHNCPRFSEFCAFFRTCDPYQFNKNKHVHNAVLNNCKIIHRHNNNTVLDFLEAYYIKLYKPSINFGIRASKELVLFK